MAWRIVVTYAAVLSIHTAVPEADKNEDFMAADGKCCANRKAARLSKFRKSCGIAGAIPRIGFFVPTNMQFEISSISILVHQQG